MRSDYSRIREKLKKIPYREKIARFCENVIEALNPSAIILYGSLARGDYKKGSDIDIIVVAENLPQEFTKRIEFLLRFSTGGPIEPRGYTPQEFLKMIEEAHGTVLDAVAYGIVLYDRGFIEKAEKQFRKTVKTLKLKRVINGWKSEKQFKKFKSKNHQTETL